MEFIIIQTTYPKLNQAQNLAQILLNQKLAACVELKKIDSYYLWQEKIENSKEILVTIKTKKTLFQQIKRVIKKNHPYEVPQIFSVKIDEISKEYLKWFNSNLK